MVDSNESSFGDDVIRISIHHGGKLNWIPKTEYVGGQVTVYYFRDQEDISMESLRGWSKALGYGGLHCLYYRIPQKEMDKGLVLMMDKCDLTTMLSYAMENDNKIDIYIEHGSFEIDEEPLVDKSEVGKGDMSDEGGESEYYDSDYSMIDDDLLFYNNVDGVEWVGRLRTELGIGEERVMEEEGDNDYDSDDLDILPDNEVEDELQAEKRRRTFSIYKDTDNPKWKVGMIFTDYKQCREAIVKHSVTEGRMIKFVKSDRTRVKAVCKDPCPWTCPSLVGGNEDQNPPIQAGDNDNQNPPTGDNDNQNQIDEEEMNGIMNQIYGEEMHSTYTEMLLDYPEEGPGMTQPTQKTAFGKFTNRANNPICLGVEEGQSIQEKVLHNSYTGPMKLGKQMPPPVKQYKAIVGKTKLTSAPFLSHGKNVITRGALTSALNNLKNAGTGTTSGKGKEKQP